MGRYDEVECCGTRVVICGDFDGSVEDNFVIHVIPTYRMFLFFCFFQFIFGILFFACFCFCSRSEERRVGTECRSCGSPYHL